MEAGNEQGATIHVVWIARIRSKDGAVAIATTNSKLEYFWPFLRTGRSRPSCLVRVYGPKRRPPIAICDLHFAKTSPHDLQEKRGGRRPSWMPRTQSLHVVGAFLIMTGQSLQRIRESSTTSERGRYARVLIALSRPDGQGRNVYSQATRFAYRRDG